MNAIYFAMTIVLTSFAPIAALGSFGFIPDPKSITPFYWIPGWIGLLWFLDILFVQLPKEQQ